MTSVCLPSKCLHAAAAVALLMGGPAGAVGEALRCRIHFIDGRNIDGRLISIDPSGRVEYRTDASVARVSIDEIETLMPISTDFVGPRAPQAVRPGDRICTFFLADGGELTGRFVAGSTRGPGRRTVRVDAGIGRPVDIPFGRLVAVRLSAEQTPSLEPEFQARIEGRQAGRDMLIMGRAGKPVAIAGALENLSPDGWEFAIGNRTRSGALRRAYGIVLGSNPVATAPLPAMVRLFGGNRFTARIVSANSSTLVVDAGPLGEIDLSWRIIQRVDLQSGRVVYVSDLEPADLIVRSIIGGDWPPQRNRNVTGGPITIGKRSYARGIGVHAYTALVYELNAEFERFMAEVGIDDSMGGRGNAIFRVRGDGRVLFESPPMSGGDKPVTVSVTLAGVQRLTLECDEGKGLNLSDHGNWADARLIRTASVRGREN